MTFSSPATGGASGVKYVNPEWWGAKGDARADDSQAIQLAYEAALTGATPCLQLLKVKASPSSVARDLQGY